MNEETNYQVGIYCRLSKDDEQPGESSSIGTQRAMLLDYCSEHGYAVFVSHLSRRTRAKNAVKIIWKL